MSLRLLPLTDEVAAAASRVFVVAAIASGRPGLHDRVAWCDSAESLATACVVQYLVQALTVDEFGTPVLREQERLREALADPENAWFFEGVRQGVMGLLAPVLDVAKRRGIETLAAFAEANYV